MPNGAARISKACLPPCMPTYSCFGLAMSPFLMFDTGQVGFTHCAHRDCQPGDYLAAICRKREYDASSGFMPIPPEKSSEWFPSRSWTISRRSSHPTGSYFLNIKEHLEDGERSLYVKDLVIAHQRIRSGGGASLTNSAGGIPRTAIPAMWCWKVGSLGHPGYVAVADWCGG
jgi:hypothetical protein